MDDTKREWVRSWLTKAHSDLRSAVKAARH